MHTFKCVCVCIYIYEGKYEWVLDVVVVFDNAVYLQSFQTLHFELFWFWLVKEYL